MNLVVDAGNSRLKWAFAEGDTLHGHGECALRNDPDGAVRALLAAVTAPVARMLVANVAGPWIGGALERSASRLARRPAEFVRTRARCAGLECLYADPSQLGVDRWLAVLAAHCEGLGPAVIVDAGTAATVDALTGDGRHLGGWIVPGVEMMAASLYRETSDIPRTQSEALPGRGADAFGRSTVDGVWFGARWALAGAVERAVSELADEAGSAPAVVLTGGGAPHVAPCLDQVVIRRPYLVLEGLARVAVVDEAAHA